MATVAELAYLAGVIDGEGCIDIVKTRPAGRRINPSYKSRLRVANTDLRLLQWIQSKFGGYVYQNSDARGNRRNVFDWCVNDDDAVVVLKQVMEFMVVKKEQAELLIEFRSTFDQYYGRFGLSTEVIAKRDSLHAACANLKLRAFNLEPSIL